MSLQVVGVSTVKVLVLLGAGLTGTFLINNGQLLDFVSDISKVLSKHLDSSSVGDKVSSHSSELYKQLENLRKDMAELSASRSVTVVNGPSSAAGGNVASMAMPVVVVGAAGYGYFRWRGWSLSDFLYVTKRHMTNAITEVSKQFDQVSTALSATRRHLTSRLDDVSKTLETSAEDQVAIKDQVGDLRTDLAKCGGNVQVVQQTVEDLELKLSEFQAKQDFAKRGIFLLCQFVQGIENGGSEKLELPQMPKPQLLSGGALKELEDISKTLEKASSSNSFTASRTPPRPMWSSLMRTFAPQ